MTHWGLVTGSGGLERWGSRVGEGAEVDSGSSCVGGGMGKFG